MHFFFYGTLLDGSDNPVARSIHAKLVAVGQARMAGSLHAVPDPEGWYPALLASEGVVSGGLYAARDDFGAADLARMDAYEDCDPCSPQTSLYRRVEAQVAGPRGAVAAQVYLFHQPLPEGSRPIPGGDFRAWIAEHGGPVFGGTRGG